MGFEAHLPGGRVVGRAAEIDLAVASVIDGGQILVAGEAGVGKTTLLGALIEPLTAQGFTCLRASATAGLAHHPLAGLGHLLGDPGDAVGPALASWAVRALHSLAPGTSAVVLVDDAHLLDSWSLHALVEARAGGGPRLVMAARTNEPWPELVTQVGRRPGIRLDVQRLSRNETAELAMAVLGVALDTPSAARVHEATDGLPLAVDELLRYAQRRGALVLRSGLLRWDPGDTVDRRLATLLGLRVAELGPSQRDLLDLLCIVDELPVEVMNAAAPGVDLVDMEQQRLVRSGSRSGWLTIGHPLLHDASTGMLGSVRRHDLTRRLVELLGELAPAAPAALDRQLDPQLERQRVVLSVDVGVQVDRDALLAVVRWGRAHGLWQRIVPVMKQAWIDSPGPFTGLAYGEALYWTREMEASRRVFEAAIESSSTEAERVPLTLALARTLEIGLGQGAAGVALRGDAREAVTDPALALDIEAAEAERRLFDGDVATIIEILARCPDLPHVGAFGAARYRLTQASIGALGMRGLMEAAEEEYTLHLRLSNEFAEHHPLALGVVEPWWVASNLLAGRIDLVRPLLAERYESALAVDDGLSRPLWALPKAIERWLAGDLVAAEHFAREAMGVPEAVASIRRMATHFLARVLELRGDPVGALEMSLQTTGDDYVGIVRSWGAGLEARCRSSINRSAVAEPLQLDIEVVMAAVDDALDHGLYVSAAYVLHDLARAGAPHDAVDVIARLVEQTDADSVRWMSTHVHALAHRDPTDGLLDEATAAAAAGATALAAQMLDDGLTLCVEQRRTRLAVEFSSVLDGLRPRLTGWPVPERARHVPSALGLSRREEEVARAAADGWTDAEIATRLFISVRTVNAHLRTVYRKLGLDGRRSLRSVLAANVVEDGSAGTEQGAVSPT